MLNPNYSTQGKSGKPALMRYTEIADLLMAAESLNDLWVIAREMEEAHADYSDEIWQGYHDNLHALYLDKMRLYRLLDIRRNRAYS